VITKGGRVLETLNIARAHGAEALGVAMIVDRSGGSVDLGLPLFSLLRMDVETFAADNLPPDLAKLPIQKPGSK
jgi:orotate phosphoribosyltransferase